MYPITPVPKKKRLSGIEKLQINIPSADVKREQRKRKQESVSGPVSIAGMIQLTGPCLADLLRVSVGEDKDRLATRDDASINCILQYDATSDEGSDTCDINNSTNTSNWGDDDEDEGSEETDTQRNTYYNRIIDFKALNLQQSLTQRLNKLNEDYIAAGSPAISEKQAPFWPKNKQGQPKKDYGKLSLAELPPRTNLADPTIEPRY